MTAFVLDASVAAKWFLAGPDELLGDEALLLLRRFQDGEVRLVVPDVFWPELGNILWKAVRRRRMSQRSAEESIETALGFDLPTLNSQSLLRHAMNLAITFDRTVYDALYVAVAARLRTPLITADERLVNAVGSRFPVRWLGAI